jgi:hypothetical protein
MDEEHYQKEWRKAHQLLLEHEKRFGELCSDFSAGRIPQDEIEDARFILEALRLIAEDALTKAYPTLRKPHRE